MWENAVKNTPKESTDQMGPSHSRLRVPMPKEEYFDLANVVEHGKGFVMESKKRKIGNAEDVAQAQGMLCTGHASFGNSMFDAVGGESCRGSFGQQQRFLYSCNRAGEHLQRTARGREDEEGGGEGRHAHQGF